MEEITAHRVQVSGSSTEPRFVGLDCLTGNMSMDQPKSHATYRMYPLRQLDNQYITSKRRGGMPETLASSINNVSALKQARTQFSSHVPLTQRSNPPRTLNMQSMWYKVLFHSGHIFVLGIALRYQEIAGEPGYG